MNNNGDFCKINKDLLFQSVRVYGTIVKIAETKNIVFIKLEDKNGKIVQVIVNKELHSNTKQLIRINNFVKIEGILKEKADGNIEIEMTDIQKISSSHWENISFNVYDEISLMQENNERNVYLVEYRRIMRIKSFIINVLRRYLLENRFVEVFTPKIVRFNGEGGTNQFEVKYYDWKYYLTQSSQLYKEILSTSGLENIFEIAYAYRAEKSDSPWHLTEFISLDCEISFINEVDELTLILQKMIYELLYQIEQSRSLKEDLEVYKVLKLNRNLNIKTYSYEEAKELILKFTGKKKIFWNGIDRQGEQILTDLANEETGMEICFIKEYPFKERPFYSKRENDRNYTKSVDLIIRGIEICSGSIRTSDYDEIAANMKDKGISEDSLENYINHYKTRMIPHGGFGIGLERLIATLLNMSNAKVIQTFKRDYSEIKAL